ncbi:MAG: glycoside hydrolase family 25 protein [Chitinophagaceae bacterium]|nr:glycoside hydrolase family 25 protein [Chitinophagaceae bacterium]
MKYKITWKKVLLYLGLLLFFVIIVVSTAILYLNKQLEKKSEQTFYKSFEIAIPNNYRINGIDVSKHQSYIYWNAVKEMKVDSINIDFVFVKATEGADHKDEMFERNWRLLKTHQITHGAYLYFIPLTNGKAQALNYINHVKLEKGNLPPVVDIEKTDGLNTSTIKKRLIECLKTLELHYKAKPIIYTYTEFYDNFLGNEFNEYPLWIAHYTEDKKPNIKRDWLFWQHSSMGRINGITEKVDFNVFNGDSMAFRKILIP